MLNSFLDQLALIGPVDWIATFTGLIGVFLSVKERVSAWPFLITCSLAYIYICIRLGYYASASMNAVFVGIAVYGWCNWAGLIGGDKDRRASPKVSRLSSQHWPYVTVFIALFTLIIGTLLAQTNRAQLPYFDAFAVGTSLAAQWMLSRKHIENWLLWVIADVTYVGIYFSTQHWTSVFLFCTFTLLACKGWHDWKQLVIRDDEPSRIA